MTGTDYPTATTTAASALFDPSSGRAEYDWYRLLYSDHNYSIGTLRSPPRDEAVFIRLGGGGKPARLGSVPLPDGAHCRQAAPAPMSRSWVVESDAPALTRVFQHGAGMSKKTSLDSSYSLDADPPSLEPAAWSRQRTSSVDMIFWWSPSPPNSM